MTPPKLFIDSSAFIALANSSETLHERAALFISTLTGPVKFVTTNFILDETITRIRTRVGIEPAYQLGKEILSSDKYSVISITDEICGKALEKMKKFSDKTFSFTDCTSFVVMEQLKISDAFAFDEDFARAGFQIQPGEE